MICPPTWCLAPPRAPCSPLWRAPEHDHRKTRHQLRRDLMTITTRHAVRIDRTKTLGADPGTGHNRWHPDIPPLIRCDPGEEVILETRDAFDGQFGPDAGLDVVAAPNLDLLHPLTGPVYVNGAEPGDLLDIEILDIEPD